MQLLFQPLLPRRPLPACPAVPNPPLLELRGPDATRRDPEVTAAAGNAGGGMAWGVSFQKRGITLFKHLEFEC